MSNDVHLAKVNKLQKTLLQKTEYDDFAPPVNQRRFMVRTKSHNDDGEILFSATSPTVQQHVLYNESESSPDHTQRDTNESDNNISSCSTLDIVNKMENMTLQSLETQVRELTQQLRHNEMEKSEMQHQLQKSNADKEMCIRRMEVLGAAHECRITEMHCVIAELSKKLRAKQDNTILEEQEPDGSEISYQEVSVYNSELNLTNPDADAECQTDPLDVLDDDDDDYSEFAKFGNPADIESCTDLNMNKTAFTKGQVEALQEEVLHLKAQIALLHSEIADSLRLDRPIKDKASVVPTNETSPFDKNLAYANNNYHSNNNNIKDIKIKDENVADDNSSSEVGVDITEETCNIAYIASDGGGEVEAHSGLCGFEDNPMTYEDVCSKNIVMTKSQQKTSVVPKLAERVKLRNKSNSSHQLDERKEFLDKDSEKCKDTTQFSIIDVQSLNRQIEQLKLNNTVLSLTLNECKEHCDHLYLLCGKYESNAIALQLAVNCSDRAIEAYDVMLALLESNMALMLTEKSTTAEDNRKSVELVARHLLERLDSEKADVYENSLGPWQNTILEKKFSTPWTTEDDNRLRYHVSKLKGRRATVQTTIVQLESPFSQHYEQTRLDLESKQQTCEKQQQQLQQQSNKNFKDNFITQNLELAVLTQELLDLHEENITLKLKLDDCERERKYALQRNNVLQEVLSQLQVQLTTVAKAANIDANKTECTLFQKPQAYPMQHNRRASYAYTEAEAEAAAHIEQQLIEALTRENELKTRIQTLIGSVTSSQKLSDDKYEELHRTVCEMQKVNHNLTQQLEQNKRKYHMRVRKLEQRFMEMSMEAGRHQAAITMQQKQSQPDMLYTKCKNINHMNNGSSHVHNNDVPETNL